MPLGCCFVCYPWETKLVHPRCSQLLSCNWWIQRIPARASKYQIKKLAPANLATIEFALSVVIECCLNSMKSGDI